MEEEKNNEQKQDQQIESKLKDMGREVAKNAKKKVKVIAMNVISSVSLLAFKISLIVVVVIWWNNRMDSGKIFIRRGSKNYV